MFKYVEDMTIIINIDNENVDDLEAAENIWVNILDEKFFNDSIMNETQKDIFKNYWKYTLIEKTGLYEVSINNNISIINNYFIVSIKSICNSMITTIGNNFNNFTLSDLNFL